LKKNTALFVTPKTDDRWSLLPVNPLIELEQLCSLFPEPEEQPLYLSAEHIAREATPEPYHRMLVHEHHMTIEMESYHDCSVDVEVVDSRFEDDLYCRKILLNKQGTRDVVQFGIVRFNFSFVTDAVRREIESESIPLGRVLIQHNILRHIDLGAIVKFEAGPGLSRYLCLKEEHSTFGRMATIFCNGSPAVDLLEISAPLK
jgi:chorismate-pyruvate lyase